MHLTKTLSKVSQESEYPGILKAKLEHEIKQSTGTVDYLGPKIDPEQWMQVLSFFRWVNSTMHSEAQVRFYVNPVEQKTLFWAFPQKARTGMSAQEIDCKEHDSKLGEIQGQGYTAFGTNHSHCNAGAFQSGTDENDEKNQHGLHITMGHVDRDKFDMHARFYLNGYCFDPDLSAFWDIGDELKSIVPEELWNNVARHQMCKFRETKFPDEWKSNVIEMKTPVTTVSSYGGYQGGLGYGGYASTTHFRSVVERGEDAIAELVDEYAKLLDIEPEEMLEFIKELESEPYKTIIRVLDKNNLISDMDVVQREVTYVTNTGKIKGGKLLSDLAAEQELEQEQEGIVEKFSKKELSDLEQEAWGIQ